MKIAMEFGKLLVFLVTFVAVLWLFNAIWGDGDGFTTRDALGAVIAGSIFYIIFYVIDYLSAKRKRNRSDPRQQT